MTLPLVEREAIADLLVGVSTSRHKSLVRAGTPVPAPLIVHAVIDAGSHSTMIDFGVVAPLGILPTGVAEIHTPSTGGGGQTRPMYDVNLAISDLARRRTLHTVGSRSVIVGDRSGTGTQAIVGPDVLQKGSVHA